MARIDEILFLKFRFRFFYAILNTIVLALITLIYLYIVSVLFNHQRKSPEQHGANKVPGNALSQLLENGIVLRRTV